MRYLWLLLCALACAPNSPAAYGSSGLGASVCAAPRIAFALTGQSNMVGYNSDPAPAVDPVRRAQIWMFDNAWIYRLATEPLDSNINQVDTVSKDSASYTGPGMYFAERIVE